MIKLTTVQNRPVWINSNHITALFPHDKHTQVFTIDGEFFNVKETPQKIIEQTILNRPF